MLICKINEFSERIKSKKPRPLLGLSVELTRKCNLGCRHCYLANPTGGGSLSELSYQEWLRIFDQYAEQEGLFITVTGGEPLLRSDFQELWIALKQRGFLISLFTNGSLITPEIVNFLAHWTPYEVSISLYGATEKTYRAVTGRDNIFGRVINALDMLSTQGIPLEVKGAFSKLNIAEFQDIKAIGENYCNLFRWDVDLVGAFSTSDNHPQDIRLSAEECVEIEAADPIRNKELENRIKRWKQRKPPKGSSSAFSCNIGYSSAYIDAYGRMHPCLPLESLSCDVKKDSLQTAWEEKIPAMLRDFPCESGPCQECEAFEICGQCVAFALLEKESATGPVPFRCQLAQARARKYGLDGLLDKIPLS